ncbi:hypothetical protein AB0I94_35920 [Streptomyces sp. NPDC050147]|uniref:hypothetical protein n=1 Tax=Streptomyces sp. NPDC050147 TaxID=3155513 RepID=UPI003421755E
MTATLRQTANTVASSMIEGASMATALIGGAGGAYIGYELAPTDWSDGARIAFAGAVAVVGAVAIDGLAELVLAPMRRLMHKSRSTASANTGRTSAPAPADTLDQALAQVATATEDDAANRAASAAWRIDQGDGFLRDVDRWRGYEDGEASFYLAPGVWLHYRSEKNKYGNTEPRFALLTGDGEMPVVITGMEQIRHRLAARAAGLPTAPVTSADDEARNDDLTGVHSV